MQLMQTIKMIIKKGSITNIYLIINGNDKHKNKTGLSFKIWSYTNIII